MTSFFKPNQNPKHNCIVSSRRNVVLDYDNEITIIDAPSSVDD